MARASWTWLRSGTGGQHERDRGASADRCAVTIQCRLHGVDCPELNTPEGKEARHFAMNWLMPYYPEAPGLVVIESYKDQRSFERWVCDVWLRDGRSVGDVLVAAGHAVRIDRRTA
jgi:endonuclease YncB( thermonuclease family)